MRNKLFICILFLANLAAPPVVMALESYEYKGLTVTLFADGIAHVDALVDVNPTLARINMTAMGTQISNLIVRDQSGYILPSNATKGYLLMSVLGSRSISVEYTTQDLTTKERTMWSFDATLQVVTNIRLPDGATIMRLEPIPTAISTVDKSTILTMPAGHVSIRYVLGIVGTKEHALVMLSDAEETIDSLTLFGITLGEAEVMLGLAWEEYDIERYALAEEYARQAKTMAVDTGREAQEAEQVIESAVAAIEDARSSGRTMDIDEADAKLSQALSAFDQSDYLSAFSLAEEALHTAQISEAPGSSTQQLIIYVAGGIAIIVTAFFALRGRRAQEIPDSTPAFDVETLFERYPLLRMEEKEVLRFVSDAGDGVFLSELRDRFDLPRSTAWRMIRRLEEMGVIETTKVGRETFVRITATEVEEDENA